MININLSIANPFSDRFSMVSNLNKMLGKYVALEANIYRTATIINLTLAYSIRQDHAGLRIEFGMLGYNCEFHIYNTRHWDYKKKAWDIHD
jgi:hypothetical protein